MSYLFDWLLRITMAMMACGMQAFSLFHTLSLTHAHTTHTHTHTHVHTHARTHTHTHTHCLTPSPPTPGTWLSKVECPFLYGWIPRKNNWYDIAYRLLPMWGQLNCIVHVVKMIRLIWKYLHVNMQPTMVIELTVLLLPSLDQDQPESECMCIYYRGLIDRRGRAV